MGLGEAFVSEIIGTGMLTLLGVGVVANVLLGKTKGNVVGANWLLITFGWGLAVFAGVAVAYKSGAHINPAYTLGLAASGADSYDPNGEIDIDLWSTIVYFAGQMIGAFLGAVVAWAAHKQHYDDPEAEALLKRGTFCTFPQIRNYGWNLVTEAAGTFVLVFVILAFAPGGMPSGAGPLWVGLLVLGIGASLGGPTGYAINPARDLGPRIAHFVLPFKGKGTSDWSYSWVPIVGPIIGGVLGGLLSQATF